MKSPVPLFSGPGPRQTTAGVPVGQGRRRRRGAGVLVVALPFLLLSSSYSYLHYTAKQDLAAILEELDRLEPDGWRLAELEARRDAVPDVENSALQIIAARKLFPPRWPAI